MKHIEQTPRTTSFAKCTQVILSAMLGVSFLTVSFAEAKTQLTPVIENDTVEVSEKKKLQVGATIDIRTDILNKSQPVKLTTLLDTVKNETEKPEPSFEVENNTRLLVQATILNSEADKLTDKANLLHSSIEEEMKEMKALVEEKKKQELIEKFKKLNPNMVITDSFEDFVAQAKKHRFYNYDLRTPSNLTGEELNRFLKGTALEGLGDAYAKAEKEYGVNAFTLIALSILESNWGKSRIAQEKNNLFGFRAYDRDPYNSAMHFTTKEECILTVARYLSENYLNPKGRYFNGFTLEGVNVKYSTDKEWYLKVTNIMNRLVKQV